MAATKLPVRRIIGDAYGIVFNNLRPLARAAAVPYAILTLSLLRWLWAGYEHNMAAYALVMWILIQIAAIVPFQTQTYRFALALTPDSRPRLGWPWGQRETMFVLHSLGLLLVAFVISVVTVAILAAFGGAGGDVSSNEALNQAMPRFALLGTISTIVALYVNARLSPVLAAAAVGRPANWQMIWRATSGNGWRIVWAIVVAIIPWIAANLLIGVLTQGVTLLPVLVVINLVANVLTLLGMAVLMTVVALVYRHLVVSGAPPTVSLTA